MAALNDLRNGLVIRLNDTIYTIVSCEHVKPRERWCLRTNEN